MEKCGLKFRTKWLKVCNSGKKTNFSANHVKYSNCGLGTLPVSEIAIVSMISMLFSWHFSGILWHPCGMLWNTMEFHGIQKIAIVSMVSIPFQWNYMASRWNVVESHGIPWDTEDIIILTVEIHGIWDSDKISEWRAMDIGTLLTIGCILHWNAMKSATFPKQCWT